MKDNKTALYAIAFILIGGLLASPSMQLGGTAYADEDEFESPTTHSDVDVDMTDTREYDKMKDKTMMKYEEHREWADRYCNASEVDQKKMLDEHEGAREYKAKLDEYCQLDESDKEQYIRDRMEEMRKQYHDKAQDVREKYLRYCDMTAAEREEFRAMHDKMTDEMKERHDKFCSMTDEERERYIQEHKDEYGDKMKDHIKDKMMDRDYVRDFNMRIAAMCDMSDEAKRKAMAKYPFLQEHSDRIAEYCHMSAEDREKYRMAHQDMMDDYREHMGTMKDRMMDEQHDMRLKMMHDKMRDYKISDERRDVLKEKFRIHYSDKSDAERKEIIQKFKAKYMQHFKSEMKIRHDAMSDLQRDQILQRIAEMRDYKAELRQKYQDMTEDERIQFQADFRDKVSDKRFAWISPHKQMLAGVAVDELECREGLNLVIKNSNGKVMCVKSATAERLIEKGLAVPAA